MNEIILSKEDQARLETQETKIQAVELALVRFGESSNFDDWIKAEIATDWEKLRILITIAINERRMRKEKFKQIVGLSRHLMYAERANARKRRALTRLQKRWKIKKDSVFFQDVAWIAEQNELMRNAKTK